MSINKIFPVFIFLISIFFSKCDTTEPPDANNGNGQDTTSHLINWFIEDIGEYGSILRDVIIINDTLAYAVGEIHRNDTLYNAMHWNGNNWTLQKIMFYTICGQQSRTPYPTSSVLAFSEDDIWIAMYGDQVARLNGTNQVATYCMPVSFSIRKLWGDNPNSLYAVGDMGEIIHYQNSNWSSIETGTDVNLRDIWGSPNGSIIWIAGFEDSYGTTFLKNTGSGFEKVLEITDPNLPHLPNQITRVFKSLWTDKEDTVYLGAIGRVYATPKNTTGYAKENIWWDYANQTGFPPETNIIRGTAGNDIFVAGYNQFVRHWNGVSWKRYEEIEGNGTWRSIAVKNNLIVAVGENFNASGNARVAIGYRIK